MYRSFRSITVAVGLLLAIVVSPACSPNSGITFAECVKVYGLWGHQYSVTEMLDLADHEELLMIMSDRCKMAVEDEMLRRLGDG